jgi:phosphoglycolate phosphatase
VTRLVVFDLDGTLVDSLRDLAESANQLLIECGGAALPHDVIGSMVGDGAATLVSKAFGASRLSQPADALARFLTIYNARLLRFTRPYDGIPEVLEALMSRVKLAVLTNKPLTPTRHILEGLGLARFFPTEEIIGGDGPWARKPDPAGLLHLVARAGASVSGTTLVGDSVFDWRTAREAGARPVLAGYGFGFTNVRRSELDGAAVVDSAIELLDVL